MNNVSAYVDSLLSQGLTIDANRERLADQLITECYIIAYAVQEIGDDTTQSRLAAIREVCEHIGVDLNTKKLAIITAFLRSAPSLKCRFLPDDQIRNNNRAINEVPLLP